MTERNLVQEILVWLRAQGFVTEMRVAKALSAAGLEIVKSSFYDDPETGVSREIDVIGRLSDGIGPPSVYAVVECKKSSKPWIVFTTDKSGFNRVQSFAIMTHHTKQLVTGNLSQLMDADWFRKSGRVGYGLATAFTDKEDETFKAGMSATKAAISLVKREAASPSEGLNHFFFPTVVLEGRLYESYLGDDENPVVAEIQSAPLLFPVQIGKYFGATVQIVTTEYIARYCAELGATYSSLQAILYKDEPEN